jgi:hypothetical protein
MTMLVNLNIASASDSQNSIIGRAFSPIIVSEMAKRIDHTTIWSTSPSAIAWMTEVGKVWRKIWSHVWCVAAIGGGPEAAGSTRPTPGRRMLTASNPMRSAIVVTTSK